ncbi:MAG: type II secretion system F family protein, partial [Dehalococcoidales bacterium]|nr:type II secretion system F family protein [Dehalococcoidales bacterium]
GVQEELVRGEGLSTPMSKRKVVLPLMVQMVAVGESTGNLTNSLTTVAQSYEMESDDRTKTAISLIQPVMTVVIGVVVAFVAIALVSARFGVYNEFK